MLFVQLCFIQSNVLQPDGPFADPKTHKEGEDGVPDHGQRRLKHVGEEAGDKQKGGKFENSFKLDINEAVSEVNLSLDGRCFHRRKKNISFCLTQTIYSWTIVCEANCPFLQLLVYVGV